MISIDELLVSESLPIIDAMKRIDETAQKVLFVAKNRRLVASVTDGDIRRWILSKGDLKASVRNAANYSPIFVSEDNREVALDLMRRRRLDAIPVVGEDNCIVDIISWHERDGITIKNDIIDIPVIMMAGGFGSRLFPYTKVLPKPLIPIGEIPISEHIINQFKKQGCNRFYLIVNYKKNMVKAYYNEVERGYKLQFIDEEFPLGTGGGLSLMKGLINETCIMTNCDILIKEDFSKILKHHREQHNRITMVCSAKTFHIPYGIVHIVEGGGIERMEEKPNISFFTNTGCYILEPDVIENMKENEVIGFPEVIDNYRKRGEKVGVYPIGENAWLDMGQFDEMEKMRRQMEKSLD